MKTKNMKPGTLVQVKKLKSKKYNNEDIINNGIQEGDIGVILKEEAVGIGRTCCVFIKGMNVCMGYDELRRISTDELLTLPWI